MQRYCRHRRRRRFLEKKHYTTNLLKTKTTLSILSHIFVKVPYVHNYS